MRFVWIKISASSVIGPSLSVIRIIFAPRLLHSLMLDSIRFSFESVGAIAITGDPSEIKAIGPCFNSPPGKDRQRDIRNLHHLQCTLFCYVGREAPLPMNIGGSEFVISSEARDIESSISSN